MAIMSAHTIQKIIRIESLYNQLSTNKLMIFGHEEITELKTALLTHFLEISAEQEGKSADFLELSAIQARKVLEDAQKYWDWERDLERR